MINPHELKKAFPIFQKKHNGKDLVYLDNASTTQKPKFVIDAISDFYSNHNANIHRGVYDLSETATALYESAREKTAKFINAKAAQEIIFTKNTTESINLLAFTWGEMHIQKDDEIILTPLEHHSNLIPWQILAAKKEATLKFVELTNDFEIDLNHYKTLFTEKTKLVCVTGMSNVTGTVPEIKEMIKIAHAHNAKVLVDGAQSVAHSPTDVTEMDCDFLAFSSHKMLGPTGVGVCYMKNEILETLPPFLTGGGTIQSASLRSAQYLPAPERFEAGTPAIAEVIGFKAALDFLETVGMAEIEKYENSLLQDLIARFEKYPQVTMYTPKKRAGAILSFTVDGIHPHDLASIFSNEGLCIRAGQHCAHPLMEHLKTPSTARISFYLYNTPEDVEKAEQALKKAFEIFKI